MEKIKEACGIKIGDYIRDETGEIFRLTDKELEEETDEIYWYGGGMCTGCYSNQVVKHSPNIIDLIEVGDYVNGSYVEGFIEKNKFQNKLIITEAGMIDNNDIKSIVTKEQFANAEYKLYN